MNSIYLFANFYKKVIMHSEEKCTQCQQFFTQSNIARIIPQCGHNICNNCLKSLITAKKHLLKCSKCKKNYNIDKSDLENFPKNIAIIRQIRESSMSLSMASTEKMDNKVNNSDQTDINSGSMLINLTQNNSQICSKHGKPLQIICIRDKELLCAHCAIFGQHRDHQFKTIEEFDEELAGYQKSLKQISGRKKNADYRIKGQNYKTQIVKQMSRKKDQLIKQIRIKFQTLEQYIKSAEEKVYDQLVAAFRGIDAEINKMTIEENKIEQTYEEWKRKAYDYMTKVEHSKYLMDKIDYFYNPKRPNLKDGESFVSEIQQKNEGINQSIKSMIESMHMEYSVSIQGYIYNYARVVASSADLTKKTVDMTPRQKSISSKKPIKVQFVKSDAINENPSRITSRKSGRMVQTKSKSPELKQVRSNPKLGGGRGSLLETKVRSPVKNITPKKKVNQDKHASNLQFAERMLNQFKSSTDTLDITGCQLSDNEIVYVIELACAQKPIKCLKLSKNRLTSLGLKQILGQLPMVTNMNLSHNLLTDQSMDQIIKHRQYLTNLRIVNISQNKLNQRKVKSKIDQLKRLGIIVTL